MIFGWGHQKPKYVCDLFRNPCINCDEVVNWQLYEIAYYYTIFFIPVYSYKSEYRVMCPNCGQNYQKDSIQFDWLSRRAKLYESFENNDISRDEYRRRIRDLKSIEKTEAEEHGVPTEEEIKEIIKDES